MVQAGMRERCVWLLASQPSSVHVRTVYLNKGCFGHWALRTGKLLFGIHSSKSLQ